MSGKYPSSFYRVSLKAIIRNEKDEVLVVRENGSGWSFPGGGMDHGEDEKTALARELFEEVAITAPFEYRILGPEPIFIEEHEAWLLWIVYDLEPEAGYDFGLGEDADEVAFKNPLIFKNDDDPFARLIYKWAIEKSQQ